MWCQLGSIETTSGLRSPSAPAAQAQQRSSILPVSSSSASSKPINDFRLPVNREVWRRINLECRRPGLTVDKWHEIIGQIQEASTKKTRLGIPSIYGIDSIHGAGYVLGTTLFPQQIGMAATWNPELMKRSAEIAAIETRAAGIPWTFSPVLDLGRQPLWPRFWETFGEDPYLAGVLGVAFVRGMEGSDLTSRRSRGHQLKTLRRLQCSPDWHATVHRPGFRRTICASISFHHLPRPLKPALAL